MSGSGPRASVPAHEPARSLELYLLDLQEQFDALPLTSRARGPLALRIREIEAEIDARSGT